MRKSLLIGLKPYHGLILQYCNISPWPYLLRPKDHGLYMLVLLASPRWRWCPWPGCSNNVSATAGVSAIAEIFDGCQMEPTKANLGIAIPRAKYFKIVP